MKSLDLEAILEMQRALQEKYQDRWTKLSPQSACRTFLWMIGEVSEAADILKKDGEDQVMQPGPVRAHFIEELCDVLMYFGDVLLCFGIDPQTFCEAYVQKHSRNMNRW